MFCIMNQLVYYAVSYSELARHYTNDTNCSLFCDYNEILPNSLIIQVIRELGNNFN